MHRGKPKKIIENHTTKGKKPGSWWRHLQERQAKKPEYKSLRHHKKKLIFHGDYEYTTIPDCLKIMQPEEWLHPEYENLFRLRDNRLYIHETPNIPFQKISRYSKNSRN